MSSTQDVAREKFDDLPLLVIAAAQTEGRGRSGAGWQNADRSLAVSLIFEHRAGDRRPFSLMAGVAAVRVADHSALKWPNDVLRDGRKIGGILVERSEEVTIVGLGLNLWWESPPDSMGSLYDSDPGEERHAELGALWGAELMELIGSDGWPLVDYRASCRTLGQEITWEPEGRGRAIDVAEDGALIVETAGATERIVSGSIRHVRVAQ